MPRLFISQREIDFFNDITKEVIKDIIGQKITYWPVSMMKTNFHPVYNEAIQKIFENPLTIDALVGQPNWETKMTQFGPEQYNKLEVFFQARDLQQKGIEISEGDFFTYGTNSYEIVSVLNMNNYFGQAEHDVGIKLVGMLSRNTEFDPKKYFKPGIDDGTFEQDSRQQVFEQQRGFSENSEGPTGDIRDVQARLGDDAVPVALGEGPRKVGPDVTLKSNKLYED